MLFIEAAPEGFEGTIITSSPSGIGEYKRSCEPAGENFEKLIRKYWGWKNSDDTDKSGSDSEDSEEGAVKSSSNFSSKKRDKKLKTTEDYYELLGLELKRWLATPNDIKKAYRNMVLKYHPDKAQGDGEEYDDTVFKKIQEAHDVLSDVKKRVVYDSQDSFDDTIPSANEEGDFFEIYRDVFARFSRWSQNKNVPSMGDLNTEWSKVDRFYNFWWNFKSWRDFSFEGEYDLKDAECREEKRWMERQNKKVSDKLKKEEKARIIQLVDMAYKKDPRVVEHEKELKDKKQKAKEEKKAAIRKFREDQQKATNALQEKKIEEAKVKQEQEADQKKERAQLNKVLRSKRTKLRSVCRNCEMWEQNEKNINDLELLTSNLSVEQFEDLTETFQQSGELGVQKFHEFVNKIREKNGEKVVQTKVEEVEEEELPWTQEEMSLLTKAIKAYPGGTRNRWDKIREMIPSRTQKQIILKTKAAKSFDSTYKPDQAKAPVAKTVEQVAKAPKANPTTITVQQEQPIEKENVKVDTEPISKVSPKPNNPKPTPKSNPKSSPKSHPKASPKSNPKSSPKANAKANPKASPKANPKANPKASPKASPKSTPKASPKAAVLDEENIKFAQDWSAEQQTALEAALKTHTSALGTERWDRIAENVPDKNRKECILRFKYLASLVKRGK